MEAQCFDIEGLINSSLRNSLCIDPSAFTVIEGCETNWSYRRKSWKSDISKNDKIADWATSSAY